MPIKCLSLWQPWSSLLAHGQKKIETRSWRYPGRVPCVMAIHAAKKWTPEQANQCIQPFYQDALKELGVHLTSDLLQAKDGLDLPFGAVVGMARLVGCYRTDWLVEGRRTDSLPFVGELSDKEKAFGDFSPGRYGWVFDQFRPLPEPIPLRGCQGVWDWDAGEELEAMAKTVMGGAKPQ